MTVRGALQKLAALGLIETKLGDGSYVGNASTQTLLQPLVQTAFISDNSLGEILQFRKMIEGAVCQEACKKAEKKDVNTLSKIYQEMVEAGKDLRTFAECDYRFHMEMAKMTENSILIQMYHIVNEVMRSSFNKVVLARGNQAGLYLPIKKYWKLCRKEIPCRPEKKWKSTWKICIKATRIISTSKRRSI